jgi:hypothetical protein
MKLSRSSTFLIVAITGLLISAGAIGMILKTDADCARDGGSFNHEQEYCDMDNDHSQESLRHKHPLAYFGFRFFVVALFGAALDKWVLDKPQRTTI